MAHAAGSKEVAAVKAFSVVAVDLALQVCDFC